MTWALLTSKRMGNKQATRTVVKAIENGEGQAVASGKRLGEAVFRRAEIAG